MEGKTEKWKNTQYDYDIYIHFLNLKKKLFSDIIMHTWKWLKVRQNYGSEWKYLVCVQV